MKRLKSGFSVVELVVAIFRASASQALDSANDNTTNIGLKDTEKVINDGFRITYY